MKSTWEGFAQGTIVERANRRLFVLVKMCHYLNKQAHFWYTWPRKLSVDADAPSAGAAIRKKASLRRSAAKRA